MADAADMNDGAGPDRRAAIDPMASEGSVNGHAGLPPWVPRVGVAAWTFVGLVAAMVIVVAVLAAVSEIALPLTFATVLAVIFKPVVGKLEGHRVAPALAAGLVVVGLLAVVGLVAVATVKGVIDQAGDIGAAVDDALDVASGEVDALGIDLAALEDVQAAAEDLAPMLTDGFLTRLVSGIGTLVGVAGGLILGALIMYYLLKDGTRVRQALVAQVGSARQGDVDGFIGDSCRTLRDYGRGRTVMSAIVSVTIGVASLLLGLPLVFTIMVVNFIGGYIPYIGAFLGGGFAVLLALGEGGLAAAAVMLVVVLAANLILENFVEPKVMGHTLDIHPLTVLVVTTLGGVVGGIVGLILAVPVTVILGKAVGRLRSRGFFDRVAERADPTVRRMLR